MSEKNEKKAKIVRDVVCDAINIPTYIPRAQVCANFFNTHCEQTSWKHTYQKKLLLFTLWRIRTRLICTQIVKTGLEISVCVCVCGRSP